MKFVLYGRASAQKLPRCRCLFLLLVSLLFSDAAALAFLQPPPPQFTFSSASCSAALTPARLSSTRTAIQDHQVQQAIHARHTVLTVPPDVTGDGADAIASAYAILPREDGGGELSSHFTKVVVVSRAPDANSDGVLAGDDVCGAQSGVVDEQALSFFKTAAADYISVLGCQQVPSCTTVTHPTLDAQLPFIEVMFTGGGVSKKSLKGNLLPIVMQQQSIDFGVAVGDAVHLLVESGGIWQGERVLMVFIGDIIPQANWPGGVEHEVALLAEQGVGNAVRHYSDLAPARRPKDYSVMLAASQTAGLLGMQNAKVFLGGGNGKTGAQSAAVVKWADDRWIGERMALDQEDADN
mmetsp:Transcript_18717/g.33864  ORF Transcript_18717/g.33864 Transcript_18717/m.33864 type:complete len:352 (-) Transcript_18717:88-1143(-)